MTKIPVSTKTGRLMQIFLSWDSRVPVRCIHCASLGMCCRCRIAHPMLEKHLLNFLLQLVIELTDNLIDPLSVVHFAALKTLQNLLFALPVALYLTQNMLIALLVARMLVQIILASLSATILVARKLV